MNCGLNTKLSQLLEQLSNNFLVKIVGLVTFDYFRVFDRQGQMLYSTSRPGEGWDGKNGGRPAPPGVYVWEAAGVDLRRQPFRRSGTVILIR